MDVKQFFQRVREVAMQLPSDAVVIKSLATTNGGKAGVMTEAGRQTAATEIVNGSAVLASAEETTAYYQEMEAKRQVAERAQALTRFQISLSTAAQLHPIELRGGEESGGE